MSSKPPRLVMRLASRGFAIGLVLLAGIAPARAGTVLVAHRGNSAVVPENTLAAIRAVRGLADYIEFDVTTTSDGHLVVMHDDTVDRTTNGRGRVDSLTLAQVRALDAGSKFGPAFAGEKVPLFDEAIAAILPQAQPIVDHKTGTPEQYVAAFRRNNLVGRAILNSPSLTFLRAVNRLEPGIDLMWVGWGRAIPWDEVAASGLKLHALLWQYGDAGIADIEEAHLRGQRLMIFTVNTAAKVRELARAGADGVYTDDVDQGRIGLPTEATDPGRLTVTAPRRVRAGQWLGLKVGTESVLAPTTTWKNSSGATETRWTGYVTRLPSDFAGKALSVTAGSGATPVTSSTVQVERTDGVGRIANLSALLYCGVGTEAAAVGFILGSNPGCTLLLRSVGGSLEPYGVRNTVRRPRLLLHDFQERTNRPDDPDGRNPAALSSLAASVGAFALAMTDDDAQILKTDGGSFTATVETEGGAPGNGLVECYDARRPEAGVALRNISARARIRGQAGMKAGFVIDGSAPKTVLIRGVGPTLQDFGVSGALIDPALTLHRQATGEVLAQNDDWGREYDEDTVSRIQQQVGAFPLRRNSKDSILILTLEPDAYSVTVAGRYGTEGIGLIEIYDLDL